LFLYWYCQIAKVNSYDTWHCLANISGITISFIGQQNEIEKSVLGV